MMRTAACAALVAIGLVHGTSYLLGLGTWQPLGFHFLVSPLPLVFNKAGPVETYARRFVLDVDTRDGRHHELRDDAAVARALDGPFTRRKIYLELFLFWDTWESAATILQRGFCGPDPVSRELGITEPVSSVAVTVRSAYRSAAWHRTLSVSCPP